MKNNLWNRIFNRRALQRYEEQRQAAQRAQKAIEIAQEQARKVNQELVERYTGFVTFINDYYISLPEDRKIDLPNMFMTHANLDVSGKKITEAAALLSEQQMVDIQHAVERDLFADGVSITRH